MDKQPEALRLADELKRPHWTGLPINLHTEAAAELRRMYALNQELLEALTSIAKNTCCDKCQEAALVARAAIAKAKEQT